MAIFFHDSYCSWGPKKNSCLMLLLIRFNGLITVVICADSCYEQSRHCQTISYSSKHDSLNWNDGQKADSFKDVTKLILNLIFRYLKNTSILRIWHYTLKMSAVGDLNWLIIISKDETRGRSLHKLFIESHLLFYLHLNFFVWLVNSSSGLRTFCPQPYF